MYKFVFTCIMYQHYILRVPSQKHSNDIEGQNILLKSSWNLWKWKILHGEKMWLKINVWNLRKNWQGWKT